MPSSDTYFKGKRASKAGKKSKRPSFDKEMQILLEKYLDEAIKTGNKTTKKQIMLETAFKAWMKGNYKLMAYLIDRAHGKAKQNNNIDVNIGGEIDHNVKINKRLDAELKRIQSRLLGKA